MATVSGGTTSERFGFIHRYGQELGVVFLCKWLAVSRSGYYAWLQRGITLRTHDDQFSIDTLMYVLKKRGFPRDVIVHTDRGVEYTGYLFQETVKKYGLIHSVNRPDYCTDNALMESFCHSLKAELIRGSIFTCVSQLRQAIKGYINNFYNRVRLHSGLGYVSPIEYEHCLV